MHIDKIYDLAFEKYSEKNYNESILLLNDILKEEENHYQSWNLLGNIFYDLEDLDKAKEFFLASINKKNDYFESYFMLASVLFKAQHYSEAIEVWLEGIKYNPTNALSYANIATAYNVLNHKEQSIFFANKALNLDNTCLDAIFCLIDIYKSKVDIENSLKYIKKLLEFKPNHSRANVDLASIYFSKEEYLKAFEHFEYRKNLSKLYFKELSFEEYKNENLDNKHLLLYHEEKVVDSILFIRFINKIKIKGLAICSQACLNRLFSYNFPNVEFLDEVNDAMDFDYKQSLLSIPYLTKTNQISDEKYLTVEELDLEEFINANIKKESFNIGLALKTSNESNDIKSLFLKELSTILENIECTFYNIQKEEYLENDAYNIKEISKNFNDYYDTAVAIKALDLVICVDSIEAHLAGALGIPCYLIDHKDDLDFRCLNKNKKALWYKCIEIYKNSDIDLINDNIEKKVKEKLNEL